MSAFVIRDFDAAGLARYVSLQLDRTFPDSRNPSAAELAPAVADALERTRLCFTGIARPKYRSGDDVLFNPLHPDHYAAFLYLLANVLSRRDAADPHAFRVFYLNKVLHGLDAYPDIELPEVFQFMHPLGTVLGHARYGNYFCVYQGCSVGSDEAGRFPVLGEGVVLYAGSAVIGPCKIGSNVVLGAGARVMEGTVPDNTLVKAATGPLLLSENRRTVQARRFR